MRTNRKFKVSFNSPVVICFTAVCFAALALGWLTKGWTTNAFFSVYHSSLLSPLTYVRLIGHVFGHAGWEHFINNIMLLLIVGPLLEEKYGSSNLLFVILATALVTGIVNYVFFSACTASWRKRRGVRVYTAVPLYQREGGEYTDHTGAGGGALYRRTDLQRCFQS